MDAKTPDPIVQHMAWVVRHRFRDSVYLTRDREVRSWPAVFSEREHADQLLATWPEMLRPDWVVVQVQIKEWVG